MNTQNEAKGDFFRTWKSDFRKCLEPRFQCARPAIAAHSIQNSRVIDLLCSDGHVISPQLRFNRDGPQIEFRRVGRNDASTFPGFCAEHDTALFAPLEQNAFDPSDREQRFLLAYRAATRELHAVMDAGVKAQTLYSLGVEKGRDSDSPLSARGWDATGRLVIAYETYKYRLKNFDVPLLKRQFGAVVHDALHFPGQRPCIAVSSLFAMGLSAPRICLTVIPVGEQGTYAFFSYPRGDAAMARAALRPILGASGETQKYELSKLIISHIENFVLAPDHVARWSPEKQARITAAFTATVTVNADVNDHPDLMLF